MRENKRSIIVGVVILSVAFGGTFGVYYVLKASLKTDYPIVVVTSNSMYPNIQCGDLLFVKHVDPADIKPSNSSNLDGDVIIYETRGLWSNPTDQPVVHRVLYKYVNNQTGKYEFVTKGDNNNAPDPYPVPEDHVLGVVFGRIPKLGHVKLFLTGCSCQTGTCSGVNFAIPLIVVLAVMLVLTIVYDITHPEGEESGGTARGERKKGQGESGKEREEGRELAEKLTGVGAGEPSEAGGARDAGGPPPGEEPPGDSGRDSGPDSGPRSAPDSSPDSGSEFDLGV
ncbi:MAG: signal peptidase I [Promethearchaeota archaeon]